MISSKVWQVYPDQSNLSTKIASYFNCSPIIGQLLLNRSIQNVKEATSFINKEWDNWELLPNQKTFIEHINQLIKEKAAICVYGDYDVDGVTSTAMMVDILINCGCSVDFISPHRFNDGYGLNKHRIEEVARKKYNALITVDCGVSNTNEINLLKKLNPSICVLIIDHHKCPDILPAADAIVNPQLASENHPAFHLCTAGLIDYIFRTTPIPNINIDDYADFVAIGLVADVMPLTGVNRWYVSKGLEKIHTNPHQAILELCISAKISHKSVSTRDIGFTIGPRLNAAGRLGDPRPVVKTLLESDKQKAVECAEALEQLNKKRRAVGEEIQKGIEEQLKNSDEKNNHGIICAGELWHMGIVGINAARLVGQYNKPSVVIGYDDAIARGSARSVPGINIYKILNECQTYLDHFGGHSQAAGFSLQPNQIGKFQKLFITKCNEMIDQKDLIPKLTIDSNIELSMITLDFINELSTLEPFGEGNPIPTFMTEANLVDARKVGKTQAHLKCRFEQNGTVIDAIGFNLGSKMSTLDKSTVSIAFTVSKNEFNGNINPQLELIDIR